VGGTQRAHAARTTEGGSPWARPCSVRALVDLSLDLWELPGAVGSNY
jgi:hypothetical protein